MVEKLYSDFDSDIVIAPVERKTFFNHELDSTKIASIDGVNMVLPTVEDIIVLKNTNKNG